MRRCLAVAFLVVLIASAARAQTTPTTRLIPYAGTAVDAAGALVRGPVTLTFELFEDQEGGARLWRETQHVQADDRGRYLVYRGAWSQCRRSHSPKSARAGWP